MNFVQRLKRFMIGVSIGVLLSLFFFSDKMNVFTSWTPSNRVKARVLESYRVDATQSACLLDCHQLDWDSLMVLVESTDVEFGQSITKGDPKEYQLTNEDFAMDMRFAVRDSSVSLIELSKKSGPSCSCD